MLCWWPVQAWPGFYILGDQDSVPVPKQGWSSVSWSQGKPSSEERRRMCQAEESTSRSFGRGFSQVRVGCWYRRKKVVVWRNEEISVAMPGMYISLNMCRSHCCHHSITQSESTLWHVHLHPSGCTYSCPSTMSEWILYLLNASVYVWNCATSRRSRGLENPTKKWMVQKHSIHTWDEHEASESTRGESKYPGSISSTLRS